MAKTNPYISLLRTAWHYARAERRRYVLVYVLFVAANIAQSLTPVLYGWLIDKIQKDPANVLGSTLW